jgi:hypothetical protein
MALIDLAKQKYASKAASMASNWQRGFTSAEAASNYDKGVGEFLGVGSIAGSQPSSNYKRAQANAGLYAQKYAAKVSRGSEKWASNYRRAFGK